jgi:RNA polymerase sigma factor (sigma-70 family)
MSTPVTPQTDVAAERVAVRRLRSGDPQAFESLYRDYAPRLYAFCHRITGNDADAADLVQETFLRVMRRLPSLDLATLNIGAYLYATARNQSYTRVQRAARERPDEHVAEAAGQDDDLEGAPEGAALLAEQRREVRAANARLAPRQRMALALCDLEGRSYRDIGAILGIDENAVAQLVSRARIRLRQELRLGAVDRGALPAACAALLGDLSAHLDGKLRADRLAVVEEHLAGCATCRAVRVQLAEASHRYRALAPALPLLGLFEETARAAEREGLLRAQPGAAPAAAAARSRFGRRRRAGIAMAAAALLLLGALAAIGVAVTGEPGETAAATEPATAADLGSATGPDEGTLALAPASTTAEPVKPPTKARATTTTPRRTTTPVATTTTTEPARTSEPATTTTAAARTKPPGTTTTRTKPPRKKAPTTTTTRTTTTTPPPTTAPVVTSTTTDPATTTTTTVVTPPPPPPPAAGPNLVIASMTANPNMLVVVVRNSGTLPAAPSTVTAAFSSLSTPFQAPVPALAPGAVATVALSCAGGSPPAGTWTANADGLFAVAETAEGDNSASAAGTC